MDELTPPEFTIHRSRVIRCKGCPTINCTCWTPMEQDLSDKLIELIKACGCMTLPQALKWAKKIKKKGSVS
jgi:hypothetical protein